MFSCISQRGGILCFRCSRKEELAELASSEFEGLMHFSGGVSKSPAGMGKVSAGKAAVAFRDNASDISLVEEEGTSDSTDATPDALSMKVEERTVDLPFSAGKLDPGSAGVAPEASSD